MNGEQKTTETKLSQSFVDRVTAPDAPEAPDVIGAPMPMPARLRWWRYNTGFYLKRLHVCLLCLWHLRHWPWGDLSTAEWRFQLAGETAWDAFVEGWRRCD